jgi:hypothetical protein
MSIILNLSEECFYLDIDINRAPDMSRDDVRFPALRLRLFVPNDASSIT